VNEHRFFARMYERLSPGAEKRGLADMRREVLAALHGRVVEVGAGNGLNFSQYPATVTEVVAVEPEPYLREKAIERAQRATVNVEVVDGLAEALPLKDASVDGAVTTLVLCSVPDQAAALAELRRVLRPGAPVAVIEHVVSVKPAAAKVQSFVTRAGWRRINAGCNLDRDTTAAIRAAGFEFDDARRRRFQGLPWVMGVARAPGG
jgi:ubiquinone/menaquinone biosynthesis C-methylase UbiE